MTVYFKINSFNLLFHIIILIKFPDWIYFILCGQVGYKIYFQWYLTVFLNMINELCIKDGFSTLNCSYELKDNDMPLCYYERVPYNVYIKSSRYDFLYSHYMTMYLSIVDNSILSYIFTEYPILVFHILVTYLTDWSFIRCWKKYYRMSNQFNLTVFLNILDLYIFLKYYNILFHARLILSYVITEYPILFFICS